MVHAALLFLLAIITAFGMMGAVLTVSALRNAGRSGAHTAAAGALTSPSPSLRERLRRIVVRTHGDVALLGPRRRVLIEFVGALCGFPGLGWILSGRVSLGVTLLVGCPAVVWALVPMALSVVGHFGLGLMLRYILPVLALSSAGALAVLERKEPVPVQAASIRPLTAGAGAPPAGAPGSTGSV